MGLDVSHQRILRLLFAIVSHVQKDIETRKIRITVDHGLRLLALHLNQLMNGVQEFFEEPFLFLAKPGLWNLRTIAASFLRHFFDFGTIA